MGLLRKKADWTLEAFRAYWRDKHGPPAARAPNLREYWQNVVIARDRIKGQPCGYDELPIDGIVELWFQDAAALEAAFGSPAGRATMKHAKTFLGEITAFCVEEHRVV
jgi:uncharacterized protein (TIGR02118 family)